MSRRAAESPSETPPHTSPKSTPSYMRVVNPPRRITGDVHLCVAELCADWYTTNVPLPVGWSCNWNDWTAILSFFVQPGWYDLSPADVLLKHRYHVPGTIQPLLFMDTPDLTFVFFASGRYYFFDDGSTTLFEFKDHFASHDDFLSRHRDAHAIPMPFPDWDETILRRVANDQMVSLTLELDSEVEDSRDRT
ncbi:hypothetical protein C8R43DRAFT_958667 [Mycena crocata]|nr:hypothetical protein C8R43DRAFT_958667 [Mycena crocata]